jgi:hypothetical protein
LAVVVLVWPVVAGSAFDFAGYSDSGDEETQPARTQAVERAVARALVHVAMQGGRRMSGLGKIARQLVGVALGGVEGRRSGLGRLLCLCGRRTPAAGATETGAPVSDSPSEFSPSGRSRLNRPRPRS